MKHFFLSVSLNFAAQLTDIERLLKGKIQLSNESLFTLFK